MTAGVSVNTQQMTPANGLPVTSERVTGSDGKTYLLLSVPSGVDQGELSKIAQKLGAPLPTQGPAPDITLSGFVANGCHGTGWGQPSIAELVYGLELVGPGGEVLFFDEGTVPEPLTSASPRPS